MNPLFDELHRRGDWKRNKAAELTFDRIIAVSKGLSSKRAELNQDEHLSPLGRLDDLRRHMGHTFSANILYAEATVDEMSKAIERRRSALVPRPEDDSPAEIAMRAEIRNRFFDMTQAAQATVLLDPNADPRLLLAVLEAPPFLTRVNDEIRTRAIDAFIDRKYPGAIEALNNAEETLAVVRATKNAVLREVGEALGFHGPQANAEVVNFATAGVTARNARDRHFARPGDIITDVRNQWKDWSPFVDAA